MSVETIRDYRQQEVVDAFYWSHGQCCAGCDWWRHFNSVAGECTRSAPVSGDERTAMLGLKFNSICAGAGHVMTNRLHRCGDFRDSFEWKTLPTAYLQRIGFKGGMPA